MPVKFKKKILSITRVIIWPAFSISECEVTLIMWCGISRV